MAGVNGGEPHDLRSLLSGDGRDFLVRNNGEQVNLVELQDKKKVVGLYFSAHWCGPCRRFTPDLVETHAELSTKGFEVVFVSSDRDEDSFREYFSEMPWLAVPFADADARSRLKGRFRVRGIPNLVVLDGAGGKVLTAEGVRAVKEYGSVAYPFTPEWLGKLEEEEEATKSEQTLRSVLASPSRGYVLNNNGDEVPVSELEGKTVCLYFSINSFKQCSDFTAKLSKMHGDLKERGEEGFEVVLVPLDDDERSFERGFQAMPWPAVPYKDKRRRERLARYFELRAMPTLVVIGPDGKTLNANAAELVEEHGVEAYPFSPEKLAELAEIEKARSETQTLESLLVVGERDFVVDGESGAKIPVSQLVGKNILLYFSAHWCPRSRAFLPKLIQAYHEIKAHDSAFEVIFVSSDHDRSSFEEFFSGMPWLALPFGDERASSLKRKFKVHGVPSVLAAIGPSGRTVTREAKKMVVEHGSAAYPFTGERLAELAGCEVEETADGGRPEEKLKDVGGVEAEKHGEEENTCKGSCHGRMCM